ncbi:MAG: glycosyltransferase family 2 protein [Caulobacteraceae bacterium]|nr:glycosyltransferase family 2 protein [Caulobacteraceae bacterium]
MADLAVLILTRNEEAHIARALRSVAAIAREVVVVDSGSTDRTREIAESLGARVLIHPFVNYAKQFQWGLDNAEFRAGWIMRLDADEVVEADLAAEIEQRLPTLPPEVAGVNLKRKHIFMGRWIRHGGRYPLVLLRIWRRGAGRIEDRWMDEHIVLSSGQTVTFAGGFADINLNDLTYFVDKHNRYATREALDVLGRKLALFDPDALRPAGQASWKRLLKEKIYNRLPFGLSTFLYFLYRYLLRLGFLDGAEGAIYHGLQGGWYRFLVGAKVRELEQCIAPCRSREERLAALARATGYDLGTQVSLGEGTSA